MEWKITPAEVGEMMEEISDTIVSTVPEELQMNVALIFEEAYVNVAVHGYAKKTDNVKPLRILWDKDGDNYKMTFIDEGIYFDPTTYDIGEPKGDQVGGHGIRLMRELSKKMTYHKEGTENILEIWI